MRAIQRCETRTFSNAFDGWVVVAIIETPAQIKK
jgi:hypothetical protein